MDEQLAKLEELRRLLGATHADINQQVGSAIIHLKMAEAHPKHIARLLPAAQNKLVGLAELLSDHTGRLNRAYCTIADIQRDLEEIK